MSDRARFVVEGKGSFPFDMLRYDSCFPDTAHDSAAMEHHRHEKRQIVLCSVGNVGSDFPTVERWRSFSWDVVDG